MEIWLNLLIPVLAILFLTFKYHKRIAIWEYFLLFFVPLIVIVCCYFGFKDLNTTAKEYWNSHILIANYWEDWNEKVSCRHPKYCTRHKTCHGTRTVNGRSQSYSYSCTERYQCGWKHPYDVDYHPPMWNMVDNIGQSFYISQDYFNYLCQYWNNKTFQDLGRRYHTDDGDLYFTNYNKEFDKTIPIVTNHTYRNKVQASNSVYNFQKISDIEKKNYGLYDHPQISNREIEPILGWNDKKSSDSLKKFNAIFGSSKQLHMQILVFKNQAMTAAFMQEALWKGGNKNEFTLCVGLKDSLITWAKVISWTENYFLKSETESFVSGMGKINMNQIVSYMGLDVVRKFKRKEFRDFEYIRIIVPMWAILLSFFLVFGTTVGISIFVIKNEENL